jgi:hypothetical protein
MRRFFILVLASVILISGNGFALAIHTCLMSSCKTISLFETKKCCRQENESCRPFSQSRIKSQCCTSEIKYQKISTPFLTSKSCHLLPAILPSFNHFRTCEFNTCFVKRHFQVPDFLPEDLPYLLHQILI